MIKRILIITILLFWINVCPLNADTIYLKNGRTMEGLILEETPENYVIDVGFGIIGLKSITVERILRSDPDKLYKKWDRLKAASEERVKEDKLKEELAPKHLTITGKQGPIIVEALLNDKVKVNLLLDTGASSVVIKDSVGKQLGIDVSELKDDNLIAVGKRLTVKRLVLTSVSVQGLEASNVDASVLPPDVPDLEFIDGLLGMAYLKNFIVKIDQKNKKVTLEEF